MYFADEVPPAKVGRPLDPYYVERRRILREVRPGKAWNAFNGYVEIVEHANPIYTDIKVGRRWIQTSTRHMTREDRYAVARWKAINENQRLRNHFPKAAGFKVNLRGLSVWVTYVGQE